MVGKERDPLPETETTSQSQSDLEAADLPISNLPARRVDQGEEELLSENSNSGSETSQNVEEFPRDKQANLEKAQIRNLASTERFTRHFILLVFLLGIALGVGGGFIPKMTTETITEGEETRIIRTVTTGDPLVQGISFLFAGLAVGYVFGIPTASIAKVMLYFISGSLSSTSAIMDKVARRMEESNEENGGRS